MKNFLLFSVLTALAANPLGLDAKSSGLNPGQWMPKSRAQQHEMRSLRTISQNSTRKVVTEGDIKMESQNGFSYLDMPDGTTWLVELNYDCEVDQTYDWGYVEYKYTGLKGTVYNDKFEKVGQIDTPIEIPEGMEKCTSISLCSLVTKKFFNIDDKYEIMFVAYFRPTGAYGAVPYTYVLSLQNSTTPATHVQTIPGYYISAINTATDKWSEDYYMTFFGDQEETADGDYAVTFDILTKATYSTKSPTVAGSFKVDMTLAPEITGYEPQPVLLTANGKDVYVSVCQYEKSFYADPNDPMSSTMTPDNNFIINLYKKGNYDSAFSLESTTTIPCDDAPEGYVYRSYGLGLFNLEKDMTFDFTEDGSVAYIIGVSDIDNQWETVTSFMIVDKDGNTLKTFGEEAESFGLLSDIDGFPEQYIFVEEDLDAIGGLIYRFVDYPSFETRTIIPCTLLDESVSTGAALLSMSMDRTPVGSSYNYVFTAAQGFMKGDDSCHEVIWMDADGQFVRTDVINGGARCNLINPYIRSGALNPYLFNTDSNREYLYLVQRRDSDDSTQAHTELCVSNQNGDLLFQYVFDNNASEVLGALINTSTNPALWIQYEDFADQMQKTEFVTLPLNKLNGSGTAEDPYQIASPGDFALIKNNLAAHYLLVNDIDLDGNTIPVVDGLFSGTLDGGGHTVRNFIVKDSPIFKNLHSSNVSSPAVIKNLTLSHVTVDNASAILVEGGSSANLSISGVHIYKATVNDNSSAGFSSMIGLTGVNSEITGCSFDVDFNRPDAEYFGGIVGELGSGGKVIACHVSGSVKAGMNVGGIVYNTNSAGTVITDCHVNLDIDAANTIGGIVADAERGTVERNIVEGSINASTPGTSLYKYKRVEAMKVGGVIGTLKRAPTNYDSDGIALPESDTTPIVSNNVVAISSITIPEGNENLIATTHRVIGHSRVNENPAYLGEEENPDYDPNDPDSEAWIISWGDAAPAEACLANNFVIETLAVTDSSVGEGHNLTEGASVAADKLNREFFENLGYKFDGQTTAEPWIYGYNTLPELYFEQSAGSFMMFVPESISLEKGQKGKVTLALDKIEIDAISFAQSSESGFNFNPVEIDNDGNAVIEIEMLEEGSYTLKAIYNTLETTLHITGLSGINDITSDQTVTPVYDGYSVIAEGCNIYIYNIAGINMVNGHDAVSVANLPAGIYIVTATDADGNSSTLKIAVK